MMNLIQIEMVAFQLTVLNYYRLVYLIDHRLNQCYHDLLILMIHDRHLLGVKGIPGLKKNDIDNKIFKFIIQLNSGLKMMKNLYSNSSPLRLTNILFLFNLM